MDKLKLEDLIPQDSEIIINGKTYELRKMNLDDEVWMKAVFGKDAQRIFEEMDFSYISKLIFRLLKDKSDFLPFDEEGYNDDGDKLTIKVTGPMRISRSMSGVNEKLEAYYSLVACLGLSRPLLDKITEEELKKKVEMEQPKKKMKSTGEKSSTPSQVSTATP